MSNFYGMKEVTCISHFASDPEIFYNGIRADYYDLEDYLWDCYADFCESQGIPQNDDSFASWVASHTDQVFGWFEDYKNARNIGNYHDVADVLMYDFNFVPAAKEDLSCGILTEGVDEQGKSIVRDYRNVYVECNGVLVPYFDIEEKCAIYFDSFSDAYDIGDSFRYDVAALDAACKQNPDIVKSFFQKDAEAV